MEIETRIFKNLNLKIFSYTFKKRKNLNGMFPTQGEKKSTLRKSYVNLK